MDLIWIDALRRCFGAPDRYQLRYVAATAAAGGFASSTSVAPESIGLDAGGTRAAPKDAHDVGAVGGLGVER